jgi:hypothetical protein
VANEKTRVVQAYWTVKLVKRISADSQRSQEKNTAAHAKPATLYLCPQNKTPREDPEAFLVSLLEGRALVIAFFDNLNHVRDFIHHTAYRRGIFQLTGFVHFVEAQTNQRLTLLCRAADRRPGLFYNNCFRHSSGP